MHNTLILEKISRNGLGILAKSPSEGDDVDTDQILQILMKNGEDGARRDVMLTHISEQIKEIDSKTNLTNASIKGIEERARTVEDRVKRLEDAGIAGWSVKKIAQVAALITAVGIIWGLLVRLTSLLKF